MSRSLIRQIILAALGSVLLSGMLTACAFGQQKKREADLHLQIGTGYITEGHYPQALSELLTAEKLNPDNEVVQNNLGLVYFLRQKYSLAEQHLHRALKLRPNYTDALNNLARVHIETGEYDEAIRELKHVLADLTYPTDDKAYVNLGLAYFRKGDFSEAKQDLYEAIKLNRDNCLAYDLYGRSQFELEQYSSAAESFDRAVLICQDAQFDEPNYYSGLTYQKLGNSAKAIARMEEVTRLYPDGAYSKKAKAMLKLMTK